MGITETLINLPDKIFSAEVTLVSKQEELDRSINDLKQWELDQADDINNALDDNQKPLYSNDAKRRTELERRKINSDLYKHMELTRRNADKEVKKLSFEIERYRNVQANLRAICNLSDMVAQAPELAAIPC